MSSETPMNLFRHSEELQSVSAGETIFQEGEVAKTMYAVEEGEVDLVQDGKVIETVGPGGIFGELALIDHGPRSATAVAKTDAKVVPIVEARFIFLVQQSPRFSLEVMRIMARRLRHSHP
jgi:CRP/FNR family transcriptional regulator, cyclic AMP receptor protein